MFIMHINQLYIQYIILHILYYTYMHLQYNNTSYALCAFDPLTIIITFAIISYNQ